MNASPFEEHAAGSRIFSEGEPGEAMFIIESGNVELSRGPSGEVHLQLGPGDFFGEMEIVGGGARFYTATARSAVRLLRVPAAAFRGMIEQNAGIALRIIERMAERVRAAERRSATSAEPLAPTRRRAVPAGGVSAPTPVPVSVQRRPRSAARETPTPAPAAEGAVEPQTLNLNVNDAAVSGSAGTASLAPPAPPRMSLELIHEASGQRFRLRAAGEPALVGRRDEDSGVYPQVDLDALDDQRTLSRRHAWLEWDGSSWYLREQPTAANGSFVNERQVRDRQALADGDLLRFGLVELRAKLVSEDSSA